MNRLLLLYLVISIVGSTAVLTWSSVPARLLKSSQSPGGSAASAATPAPAPRAVPLQLQSRELVREDSLERLFSLHFRDPEGTEIAAYLREPLRAESTGEPLPGVVLLAGRYAGRDAATLISGSLDGHLLAVEYPYAIPERVSLWEWAGALPRIRASALQIPGILVGAARFLAEEPGVDASRIGLVGVSFGVPFAAAAGRDRIFTAVSLSYGGSDLANVLRANLPVENAWVRERAAGLGGWWFRDLDPERHVPEISPTPLLLVNATQDQLIPDAAAERLARHARAPVEHVWLPYGHLSAAQPGQIREVADLTFRFFTRAWSGARHEIDSATHPQIRLSAGRSCGTGIFTNASRE